MKKPFIVIIILLCLTACSALGPQKVRHNRSTSLVDFLYPSGNIPQDLSNPVLNLPLKVGLAFIPERSHEKKDTISQASKAILLDELKQSFESKKYVQEIVIIPDMYLSGRQGFVTLEQVKNIFQLDVIALVSYDQIVNRKENMLALTYLTIVGNYIFPGSHYDVSTLIDTVMLDIESKQILFRAAGTATSKGNTAEAYTRHAYDKHQNKGFAEAMTMMQSQLHIELNRFEQRMKEKDPSNNITVKSKPGYDMSVDLWLMLLLVVAAFVKLIRIQTVFNSK